MGFSRRCQIARALSTPHQPAALVPIFPRRAIAAAAMLRLRSCIVSSFLSSPATLLHRTLSASASASAPAPAVSPNPSFSVEEYLVATCGLTRAQAHKASTKLSHYKSPTKPDAVLAFLADLGLSSAAVAAAVAKDPLLLCAKVEKTLTPVVVGLTGHGLSHIEIARLISLAPNCFRCRNIVSKLQYYLPIFGFENLLRIVKRNSYLLSFDVERVVKPNVAFLQECGLNVCDITKLCLNQACLLTTNMERLRAMVACAEGLGVPPGSAMFRHALHTVAFLSKEHINAKVDYLKKTLRCSDADVRTAVSKAPNVLNKSKDALQRRSAFLISEVGLEPSYISRRPDILSRSLEGRLRPRYYVLKFLKENGLLDRDRDYYSAVIRTEKVFMEKFIYPHKEAAPYLAEDYAAACRREMPTTFSSDQ